ncbi:hypothetical protein Ddye_024180 [Dipteronia dyeriana]|uniref:Transposase MuDR plant domain-containing protein n=1 Tax=Dipteronia dyeriana TaxID=168575 RepID=A0AAD9TUU7_9ROSI|nr:hypothetical protein Ddye_024180 [Dipteronia dyeriana]
MNDGQFNHRYNDFYNGINNEQNSEPNVEPTQQMDDEENLHSVDNVANNGEEEEAVESERRATRVQRFRCSAIDIARTSEVRSNLTPFDSNNVRTWVIPGAQSYSFAIGGSRNSVQEEPTSMIYNGQFFPTKKDLKRLVGHFAMWQNFEWKVKRSNKTTLHLVCLMDNCTWKLRAVMRDEGIYFQKRFHRKDVAAIMDKAARSYSELKYNRHMDHNAFNYVIDAGPHKWSRVHCPERRYRVMTINVAECINSCLKFARQLPMLTLAEFIRNMLQRWFHDHHRTTQSMRHQLTDTTHLVILKTCLECGYMTVNPVDRNIFSVKRERNLDYTSLCVDFFKRQTLIDAYSVPIMPVGHLSSWIVPTNITNRVVLNPLSRRQAGRPMGGRGGDMPRLRKGQPLYRVKDVENQVIMLDDVIIHLWLMMVRAELFHRNTGASVSSVIQLDTTNIRALIMNLP